MEVRNARTLTESIRSKLFVPGSRPELFAKAMAGQADALSFDLEDSVVAAKKQEARTAVATFLRETSQTAKVTIVRVNALDSGWFADDIAGVTVPGLHIINVPKVEQPEDIFAAVEAIEAREKSASVTEPIGVLANIETPRGLRLAFEIASSHPRVVGLQLGFVDLSLACGIDQADTTALNAVRLQLRLAASEAGVSAFDGAYADVKDVDGFRVQAEVARSLGLNGKSCVHPSQVAAANEVFTPKADAVQNAVRVVAAAQEAATQGSGAFLLDGKMIDLPIVERARRLIIRAARYGMSIRNDGE